MEYIFAFIILPMAIGAFLYYGYKDCKEVDRIRAFDKAYKEKRIELEEQKLRALCEIENDLERIFQAIAFDDEEPLCEDCSNIGIYKTRESMIDKNEFFGDPYPDNS